MIASCAATSSEPETRGRMGGDRVSKNVAGVKAVEFGDIDIKTVSDASSLRKMLSEESHS